MNPFVVSLFTSAVAILALVEDVSGHAETQSQNVGVDACGGASGCDEAEETVVGLLQMQQAKASRATMSGQRASSSETDAAADAESDDKIVFPKLSSNRTQCAPLANEGASFSIEVGLGSGEAQIMKLVADTGSNAIVVASCLCNFIPGTGCPLFEPCFAGPKSESFMVTKSDITLSYGSGNLRCDRATDNAKLEHTDIKAFMTDGIYLIRDRHELAIAGEFQGILGLGIPAGPESGNLPTEKLLLEQAGVARYSMCFGDTGYLRMGLPPFTNALTSVGVYHWGAGMNGVRVGNKSSPIISCAPGSFLGGTDTPCGMIPDSGTTQLLAPETEVPRLLTSLCEAWPRCVNEATKRGVAPSARLFDTLLSECQDWMTSDEGIYEVPSIFFDLVGADGTQQTIELTAWSWVVEMPALEISVRSKRVETALLQQGGGVLGKKEPNITTTLVCLADISGMVYPTSQNGPIWILGEALFFEGKVGYDISSYPYKMQFDMDSTCDCSGPDATILASTGTSSSSASSSASDKQLLRKSRPPLRQARGQPRSPARNVESPL